MGWGSGESVGSGEDETAPGVAPKLLCSFGKTGDWSGTLLETLRRGLIYRLLPREIACHNRAALGQDTGTAAIVA